MYFSEGATHVLRRTAFRGAAAAVAGAALASALGAGSPASAATARVAAHACNISGLKVSVGSPNGAAGHIDYLMRFRNVSGAVCTVRGYPKVVALSKSGKPLGSPAARGAGRVKTVVLKPGGLATATFTVVEAGNYPASACGKVVEMASLKVTLDGTRKIAFSSPACSKPGPKYMSVSTVR